jgi:hypothetical protein
VVSKPLIHLDVIIFSLFYMRTKSSMAEETTQWEHGWQLKEVQTEIVMIQSTTGLQDSNVEIKSTMNQLIVESSDTKATLKALVGMVTTLTKQKHPM